VKEPLERVERAVDHRDAEELRSALSSSYHDVEHADAAAAVERVRGFFAAYEHLKLEMRDLRIEVYGSTARARFHVLLAGTPKNVPGFEGFLPRSSAYDFDLQLARENGRWVITTASWSGAP